MALYIFIVSFITENILKYYTKKTVKIHKIICKIYLASLKTIFVVNFKLKLNFNTTAHFHYKKTSQHFHRNEFKEKKKCLFCSFITSEKGTQKTWQGVFVAL